MQQEKINIKIFAKNLANCIKTYGVENMFSISFVNK